MSNKTRRLSKALTWEDLAKAYNKAHPTGRRAMTLPMDQVFKWAEDQPDKYMVSSTGSIHRIL